MWTREDTKQQNDSCQDDDHNRRWIEPWGGAARRNGQQFHSSRPRRQPICWNEAE